MNGHLVQTKKNAKRHDFSRADFVFSPMPKSVSDTWILSALSQVRGQLPSSQEQKQYKRHAQSITEVNYTTVRQLIVERGRLYSLGFFLGNL